MGTVINALQIQPWSNVAQVHRLQFKCSLLKRKLGKTDGMNCESISSQTHGDIQRGINNSCIFISMVTFIKINYIPPVISYLFIDRHLGWTPSAWRTKQKQNNCLNVFGLILNIHYNEIMIWPIFFFFNRNKWIKNFLVTVQLVDPPLQFYWTHNWT